MLHSTCYIFTLNNGSIQPLRFFIDMLKDCGWQFQGAGAENLQMDSWAKVRRGNDGSDDE